MADRGSETRNVTYGVGWWCGMLMACDEKADGM